MIEASKVFQFIQKLPKGAGLHLVKIFLKETKSSEKIDKKTNKPHHRGKKNKATLFRFTKTTVLSLR